MKQQLNDAQQQITGKKSDEEDSKQPSDEPSDDSKDKSGEQAEEQKDNDEDEEKEEEQEAGNGIGRSSVVGTIYDPSSGEVDVNEFLNANQNHINDQLDATIGTDGLTQEEIDFIYNYLRQIGAWAKEDN